VGCSLGIIHSFHSTTFYSIPSKSKRRTWDSGSSSRIFSIFKYNLNSIMSLFRDRGGGRSPLLVSYQSKELPRSHKKNQFLRILSFISFQSNSNLLQVHLSWIFMLHRCAAVTYREDTASSPAEIFIPLPFILPHCHT